jgi:ribosome-binding protein aMBF1 (putative translation factor)
MPGNWKDLQKRKMSPERIARVQAEVDATVREMDLRMLREAAGLTQEQLAERIDMAQSDLSKFERREDHRIATLRRYVSALGGRLKIVAELNGKTIVLTEG